MHCSWSLYAGFIAACLIHYKALEVTVTSAVTRTVGALVGATFGYVCMLRPDLADKPVPLLVTPLTSCTLCSWYAVSQTELYRVIERHCVSAEG